jgi:succinate-semialdehyde dehydrogenase/glutarate-semialdehyde dehydrogenase
MAREMGKPVRSGQAEIEKCAWVCEYYAEHADAFLASEPVESDAAQSYVAYRPIGPILGVMPWNFPFWQVFRFAAPSLMAGNTVLLKHATATTGCALMIEKLLHEAGCPDGVFSTLLIGHDQVAELVRHPAVRAVTLTGSTEAGRRTAEVAGASLKKVVLELGGSDPYLVLDDADPEQAAEICVQSRMINSGQSCIAAKRFLTMPQIHKAFVEAVIEKMRAYRLGDPTDPNTRLGPMARHELRDELHRQVMASTKAGAMCALGGDLPVSDGAYYYPTVLTGVQPGMPAADEELFGPVAAVMAARDENQLITLANQTCYGLGAAVLTGDAERGRILAEQHLDAGCCFVNAFVKSDPRLPFGGIKCSGYGRELSHFGIREFVNIKTVYVD